MINTIEHARNITGLEPFGVVGGTHLGFLEPDQLKETLEALQSYELGLIGTCHCTGPRASASLFCRFGEKVVFCSAGSTLMV
jgi:7,8-dihydropterin-6-yl-methyl-4-(beta-D-ribofuranosyl)aminobenzene 5'-phosphate synthase